MPYRATLPVRSKRGAVQIDGVINERPPCPKIKSALVGSVIHHSTLPATSKLNSQPATFCTHGVSQPLPGIEFVIEPKYSPSFAA